VWRAEGCARPLLKGIRKFFSVFKKASDHLCAASYPTLATAVPAYNFMLDKLEDYRDARSCPDAVKTAANAAIDKLKGYYSGTEAEIYPVSTILDPRFKLNYYFEHGWEQKWIQSALATFNGAYERYHTPPVPGACGEASVESSDDSYDEDMDEDRGMMMHFVKRRRIAEHDEFKEYLSAPVVTPETDILQWWKANAGVYPCLATMARDYLAIPATGAPAERVFSGGTDLVQPKRGSLKRDTVRACMCLKSWLKLSQ
jgi:hAT family C-terminal dimerisation region